MLPPRRGNRLVHAARTISLQIERDVLKAELELLRARPDLNVTRYFVEQHVYSPCGHPKVCLEKFDDCDEPLCGWCEDLAGERMGLKMASQIIYTEAQDDYVQKLEEVLDRFLT